MKFQTSQKCYNKNALRQVAGFFTDAHSFCFVFVFFVFLLNPAHIIYENEEQGGAKDTPLGDTFFHNPLFTTLYPQLVEWPLKTTSIILVVFNSHSTSLGYNENDKRGDEIEDCQVDENLLLLNDVEDPQTFFSRRWLTSTTHNSFVDEYS